MPLRWINREVWNAVPARRCVSLIPPMKHIFLTIANTSACKSNDDCGREMRILQDQHMRQGMDDIRYNFAIGGTGQYLEGRGWIVRTVLDPDCKDIEDKSLIIAFLGGYTEESLPQEMYEYNIELISFGVRNGFIDKDFEYHNLVECEHSVYKED